MSTKKSKQEQEKEMAAYFQAHKDEGEWEAVGATRPARAGMVYSIRFTGRELDSLRAIAEREGRRISDLVHDALAAYLAIKNKRGPDYSMEADFHRSRVVVYHGTSPAQTITSKSIQVIYPKTERETAAM